MSDIQAAIAALQKIEAARRAEAAALRELEVALRGVRSYSSSGQGAPLEGATVLGDLDLPKTLAPPLDGAEGHGGDDVWAHLAEEEAPVPLSE